MQSICSTDDVNVDVSNSDPALIQLQSLKASESMAMCYKAAAGLDYMDKLVENPAYSRGKNDADMVENICYKATVDLDYNVVDKLVENPAYSEGKNDEDMVENIYEAIPD